MPVVDHGLFAPRRGAAKVGRAARDTIGRINLADASIAVTKVFCSWFPTIVIRFVTASPGRAALQKTSGASAKPTRRWTAHRRHRDHPQLRKRLPWHAVTA